MFTSVHTCLGLCAHILDWIAKSSGIRGWQGLCLSEKAMATAAFRLGLSLSLVSAAVAGSLFVSSPAAAQSADADNDAGWFAPAPPPPPAPPAPPAADPSLPRNIQVSPDGRVNVTRTPQQGVDVHAQTQAGTVHAYGCNRVSLDPTTRTQDTCPYAQPQPAYPYPPPVMLPPPPPAFMPPPIVYYPAPPIEQPPPPRVLNARKQKPQYAPDPGRKAALITSSLLFGLGTAASSLAYTSSLISGAITGEDTSRPALIAMGAFLTVPASIPRFVVGDVGRGLLFTALRGGSFALGSMVNWEDPTYTLPVTLTFIAPLTLGIIDLATTPHREQLERKQDMATAKKPKALELDSLGPTVAKDREGRTTAGFAAAGRF